MKQPFVICLLTVVVALILGCSEDKTLAPEATSEEASGSATIDPEQVAQELVARAGWHVDTDAWQAPPGNDPDRRGCVAGFERERIVGDIVHYSAQVRVGQGPYDVIGIHRVVKETRPHRPIRTGDNVFFLHGDFKTFEGCFLPGVLAPGTPDDFGIAVHLAQNDVDVWGIDQAWTLVPEEETNFAFMADWGMQRQVDDLNTAVGIARIVRLITGSGHHKMVLSGYSSGATTVFALANQETQLPLWRRQVGSIIPVDQGVKTDLPEWEEIACQVVEGYQDLMDSGQFQEINPLPLFGVPALEDPDGPSELIEGLTNLQAALALGVYPFFEGVSVHFLAGIFDESEVPTGLQYTDVDLWIDFLVNAPPYEPLAFERDEYITSCSQYDVPWDDHLGEIHVPVLYVTAAGGFGYTGEYTLDLLGSADVTTLDISLHPLDEVLLDFAHIDLFTGWNAPELVWEPMLSWIRDHSHP